jgi:ribosomal protein S18 acetylase RimI-like enzyme
MQRCFAVLLFALSFAAPLRADTPPPAPSAAPASRLAVVGQLMLTCEGSDWRDGWWWWIQSVFVVPGWRRRGVYRALHDAVVAEIDADPEVCGLRLYVEPDNEGARATYRALGMLETYRVMEHSRRR